MPTLDSALQNDTTVDSNDVRYDRATHGSKTLRAHIAEVAAIADTAVQPGDNISELANDSGYITGYTVTESDVTQHEAALTITESQISDFGDYTPEPAADGVPKIRQNAPNAWLDATASNISYDNTASSLTATNVKGALDELASGAVAPSTSGLPSVMGYLLNEAGTQPLLHDLTAEQQIDAVTFRLVGGTGDVTDVALRVQDSDASLDVAVLGAGDIPLVRDGLPANTTVTLTPTGNNTLDAGPDTTATRLVAVISGAPAGGGRIEYSVRLSPATYVPPSDPSLFYDDFSSNDFSAFDSVVAADPDGEASISAATGDLVVEVTSSDDNPQSTYAGASFAPQDYVRAEFSLTFSTLAYEKGDYTTIMNFRDGTGDVVSTFAIYNDDDFFTANSFGDSGSAPRTFITGLTATTGVQYDVVFEHQRDTGSGGFSRITVNGNTVTRPHTITDAVEGFRIGCESSNCYADMTYTIPSITIVNS